MRVYAVYTHNNIYKEMRIKSTLMAEETTFLVHLGGGKFILTFYYCLLIVLKINVFIIYVLIIIITFC